MWGGYERGLGDRCVCRWMYLHACALTRQGRCQFGLINYCQLLKCLVKGKHCHTFLQNLLLVIIFNNTTYLTHCMITFLIDTSVHIIFTQMMPNLALQTEP